MACSSLLGEKDLLRFRTKKCCRLKKRGCEFRENRCQYSHSNFWLRRCPVYLTATSALRYVPMLCPKVVLQDGPAEDATIINRCEFGGECAYAHSYEEVIYHPLFYKTRICELYMRDRCDSFYCPFIHGLAESRQLCTYQLPFANGIDIPPHPCIYIVTSMQSDDEFYRSFPKVATTTTDLTSFPCGIPHIDSGFATEGRSVNLYMKDNSEKSSGMISNHMLENKHQVDSCEKITLIDDSCNNDWENILAESLKIINQKVAYMDIQEGECLTLLEETNNLSSLLISKLQKVRAAAIMEKKKNINNWNFANINGFDPSKNKSSKNKIANNKISNYMKFLSLLPDFDDTGDVPLDFNNLTNFLQNNRQCQEKLDYKDARTEYDNSGNYKSIAHETPNSQKYAISQLVLDHLQYSREGSAESVPTGASTICDTDIGKEIELDYFK